jgi:hypothetical protein
LLKLKTKLAEQRKHLDEVESHIAEMEKLDTEHTSDQK